MAKPTGGLLAFNARGSIAKTIVYSSWRGRQYVRQHVIPANPRSISQTATRDTFSFLSNAWKTMPSAVAAVWTLAAKGLPVTDRNLWIKRNLRNLLAAGNTSAIQLADGAKGGIFAGDDTVTAGVDQLTVDLVAPPLPDGWSIIALHAVAFREDTVSPTALIEWGYATDLTGPYSAVITGLTGGTPYNVGAFFQYTKPDGSPAYGAAVMDAGTPT